MLSYQQRLDVVFNLNENVKPVTYGRGLRVVDNDLQADIDSWDDPYHGVVAGHGPMPSFDYVSDIHGHLTIEMDNGVVDTIKRHFERTGQLPPDTLAFANAVVNRSLSSDVGGKVEVEWSVRFDGDNLLVLEPVGSP